MFIPSSSLVTLANMAQGHNFFSSTLKKKKKYSNGFKLQAEFKVTVML